MDAIAEAVERKSMMTHINRMFYDPEWEEAEQVDEKSQYYRQGSKCGIIFRKYKPGVAKLVMQRTNVILIPWKGEDDGK